LGHPNAAAIALVAVGLAGLVAAMLTGLHVVRPRLAPRGVPSVRASFVYWVHPAVDVDDITASLTEDRRVARLRVLSTIALRKMRSLPVPPRRHPPISGSGAYPNTTYVGGGGPRRGRASDAAYLQGITRGIVCVYRVSEPDHLLREDLRQHRQRRQP
jgi:hypothetical protein